MSISMTTVDEPKDLNSSETEVKELTTNEADTSQNIITNTVKSEQNATEEEVSETPNTVSSTKPGQNQASEDVSESQNTIKEQNVETAQTKVKSRELKSLLEAAKESNLDTNIAHKRESRKSETFGAIPTTILKRRNSSSSTDSHQSNGKRNMRSQNPEFVQKHRKFLKTVTGGHHADDSEVENIFENDDKVNKEGRRSKTPNRAKTPIHRSKTPVNRPKTPVMKTPKRKRDSVGENNAGGASTEEKKSKKSSSLEGIVMKKDKDKFCWRCHREGINIQCETCPRSYHLKCLKIQVPNHEHWGCPECIAIIRAESTKTRSPAMKDMTQAHLCELLKFAVKRMINCAGSEPFIHPVDIKSFPDYRTYVIQPMDLTTLQNNIRENVYGSTVGFTADAKWILHNSIIFNSHQSKLTTAAKAIIKICKQEMTEIETCAECYLNANTKKNTWFVEVCSKPHMLLWAKLKGFPYWPAKGMKTDGSNVDVRFFGAHDRAWVPVKECFLYSKKDPNTTNKQKRSNIAECVKEVDIHIEKLKERFGEFHHAAYRTAYNPSMELEQLTMMLPKFKPGPNVVSKFSKTNISCMPIKKRMKSHIDSDSDDGFSNKTPIKDEDEQSAIDNSGRAVSDTSDEIENLTPTSSSKTDDKKKLSLQYNISDFDKFVEGYGTEDEELLNELNIEARNKIVSEYVSDSEEDSYSHSNSPRSRDKDMKNGDDEDLDKSSVSSSDMSILSRGKVRTRGGYHNVSGKIKVLTGRKSDDFDNGRKRSIEDSPKTPSKYLKLENESPKSESEKINKLDRLPESFELSIGNVYDDVRSKNKDDDKDNVNRPEFISTLDKSELDKMKQTVMKKMDVAELLNSNKDFRTLTITKTESIADRLIKRMSLSQSDSENEKVENVKKKIFDSLEATSSAVSDGLEETEKKKEEEDSEKAKDEMITEEKEKEIDENKDSGQLENVTKSSNENKIEKAVADSQKNSSSDESDEDYLHLTTVKRSYSSPLLTSKNKIPVVRKETELAKTVLTQNEKKIKEPKKDNVNENRKDNTADRSLNNNENFKEAEKPIQKDFEKNIKIQKVKSLKDTEMELSLNVSSTQDENEIEKESTSDSDVSKEETSEKVTNPTSSKVQNTFLKIVNVGDIISGKINNTTIGQNITVKQLEKKVEPLKNKTMELVHDAIEIKTEPLSDAEEDTDKTKSNKMYEVTLSVVDKNKKNTETKSIPEEKSLEKNVIKPGDNVTKVIESVATNAFTLNRNEISLRPLAKLTSPKQKARKTFPSVGSKPTQATQIKKIIQEKKEILPNNSKAQPITKIISQTTSALTTTTIPTVNKDNLVYITQSHQNSVILPPNQPISLSSNVASPILAMVQHPLNSTNLIIQQSSPVTVPVTTHTIAQTTVTSSTESVSSANVPSPTFDILADDVSKAVGEMLCKPPPKLKPKPPGPLSTYFDEGNPSSAGPVTKALNSVAHRLSDYFRGLLKETLHDLSEVGSPEARIKALELEIENLKYKHTEEMLEFRKNISTILKDIQKSIVEERNKIIDETKATCEAERLKSVEEAKSKQWCAYCLKEAQFYCCWNTSYCDYPCQQKHWATHMKTCSQTSVRNPTPTPSPAVERAKQQNNTKVFKAVPKHIYTNPNKVVKPTRMFLKSTGGTTSKSPMYFQRPVQLQASTLPGQSTITLVESTPGNFEIIGNHGPISLDGKLIPTTSLIGMVKPTTVTTSTIGGNTPSQKAIILSQKPSPVTKPPTINKENTEKS